MRQNGESSSFFYARAFVYWRYMKGEIIVHTHAIFSFTFLEFYHDKIRTDTGVCTDTGFLPNRNRNRNQTEIPNSVHKSSFEFLLFVIDV